MYLLPSLAADIAADVAADIAAVLNQSRRQASHALFCWYCSLSTAVLWYEAVCHWVTGGAMCSLWMRWRLLIAWRDTNWHPFSLYCQILASLPPYLPYWYTYMFMCTSVCVLVWGYALLFFFFTRNQVPVPASVLTTAISWADNSV